MPTAFVQSKVTRQTASSTTVAATFTSNVSVGSIISVMCSWDGGAGVLSGIADNLGNSYTAVDGLSDGGNPNYYKTWYAKVTTGGACTVTVTFTSSRPITLLVVEEASGIDLTTPLNKNSIVLQPAPGTGANGVASTSVTPDYDGEYVFGCSMATGSSTINYTGGTAVGLTTTVRNNLGTSVSDRALIHQTGVQTTAAAVQVRATSDNDKPVVTAVMTFKAAANTPNISSVSSATPREGASLTITGTLFGASQGSGDVKINGVAQTVTSWSDTSIVVTIVLGTNKFGAAYTVVVRDNALVSSNSYAGITGLLPANSGLSYIDLGTPNATAAYRITAIADLVSGDQLEYENKAGLVTVASDGSFAAGLGVTSFNVRAWTSGSGYGSSAAQSTGYGATGMSKARYPGVSYPQRLERSVSYYDP